MYVKRPCFIEMTDMCNHECLFGVTSGYCQNKNDCMLQALPLHEAEVDVKENMAEGLNHIIHLPFQVFRGGQLSSVFTSSQALYPQISVPRS